MHIREPIYPIRKSGYIWYNFGNLRRNQFLFRNVFKYPYWQIVIRSYERNLNQFVWSSCPEYCNMTDHKEMIIKHKVLVLFTNLQICQTMLPCSRGLFPQQCSLPKYSIVWWQIWKLVKTINSLRLIIITTLLSLMGALKHRSIFQIGLSNCPSVTLFTT